MALCKNKKVVGSATTARQSSFFVTWLSHTLQE